jgi:hypothetical protein
VIVAFVVAITDSETNLYLVSAINDPKYFNGNVFILLLTESFNKWEFFCNTSTLTIKAEHISRLASGTFNLLSSENAGTIVS